MLWDGSLFKTGQELGILEESDHLLIGLQENIPIDYDSIRDSAMLLYRLICELLRDRYHNDLQAMAEDTGFRPEVVKLLEYFPENISPESFARIDLFITEDSWKFLEFNMGSLTGGMQYASLPRLGGYKQEGDVLRTWAKGLSCHNIFPGSLTLFVVDETIVKEIHHPLSIFSQAVQQETQSEVVIVGPRALSWNGKSLIWQGRVVDNIYCRFEQEQLLRCPDDYTDLLLALKAQAVNCPLGLGYNVLAGKGMWALLWQLYEENQLSPMQRTLVESYLPYTIWLSDETLNIAYEQQNDWVLKPTDGYAGRDVVCGREVDFLHWQETLNRALSIGNKAFILQRYTEPYPLSVTTCDVNGQHQESFARVVWGLYYQNGEYLGGLLRSLPMTESAVINYAMGAATGPMMKTK